MKDYITAQQRLMPMPSKKYDELYLATTFFITFFGVILLSSWGN